MFDRTGAQRVMANLSFLLAKKNVDLILINDYSIPKEEEIDLPKNARRIILDDNVNYKYGKVRKNFYRIKKLREIIKKEKPDFVLSFLEGPNKKLILASLGLKTKTVISVRCNPASVYKNILSYFIVNFIYSFSKYAVFQTTDAKAFFWKCIQKKGIIINNSVNKSFFESDYIGDSNSIVTFGRLEKEKNHKLLINAYKNVRNKMNGSQLHIYGSGSLKNELVKYIDSSDIRIIDNVTDVLSILRHCKMFILPSDTEGMPNALMESLAVGVPSISTDCPCGGPRLLIRDGYNGFLFDCGDQLSLENLMLALYNNQEIRNKFTKNSKKEALLFHPDKINNEWLNFFEKISH